MPGDQAPGGLVEAVADRLDGGGDADDGGGGREPEGRVVWSASSIQPKIRLPVRTVSGVHHQMARRTGQAATMPRR